MVHCLLGGALTNCIIYMMIPQARVRERSLYIIISPLLDSRSFIVILIPFVKKSPSIDREEPPKEYQKARILELTIQQPVF